MSIRVYSCLIVFIWSFSRTVFIFPFKSGYMNNVIESDCFSFQKNALSIIMDGIVDVFFLFDIILRIYFFAEMEV